MRIFIFIIFLLFINCASNSNQKSSCQNNGKIDFMYINIPCEKCVDLITEILDKNEYVFTYDIIRNKDSHILINYCYNYKKTTPIKIEEKFSSNNFPINKQITESQKLNLSKLCCNN